MGVLQILSLLVLYCSAMGADAQSLSEVKTKPKFETNLYSETVYDSRFGGAIHASRLRLGLSDKYFRPFVGVNFTRDLSNGSAPLFAINSWSPSLGLELRFLKYFGAVVELRRLISDQTDTLWETQYGVYGYDFRTWNSLFFEIYGESFAIDRVSNKPYLAAWSKFGYRVTAYPFLFLDLYTEVFTRVTANLDYGPDENELRLGSRLTFTFSGLSVSTIVNYAPVSDVKKDGMDALLVLGGRF